MSESENDPIRVWLVEDNERLRRTLRVSIDGLDGVQCDGDFGNLEDAIAACKKSPPPTVLLLDIGLPGVDGITGLPGLKVAAPSTRVVILTVFDDQDRVFRAVCAGADGYLLKTSPIDRIGEAIREVAAGGASMNPEIARKVLNTLTKQSTKKDDSSLTDRETEVLRLVVQGLTKKEIAKELNLSAHTIDSHLRNIYGKLHVNNRAGAVAAAIRDGLVYNRDFRSRLQKLIRQADPCIVVR